MSLLKTITTAKIPIILAPMAGLTSYPFRMLNRSFGCKMAFMEMINVKSLSHSSKRTKEMLFTDINDRPLGIQLLGQDPYYILKGLEKLKDYKFDLLDFNAACPQRKVVNRAEGADLLRDKNKLYKILKLVVDNSSWPVTVKIRVGFNDNSQAVDIAKIAQDTGVKAIFVHGRTKEAGFSGVVDYSSIYKIKKALNIEVIGSGDVFNHILAKKMLDETGCDGILVARGALGNPWIFKQIEEYLNNGIILEKPQVAEIITVMNKHLELLINFFGVNRGVARFCKFFIYYTRGFYQVKFLRNKSQAVRSKDDMINLINLFEDILINGQGKTPTNLG